MLTSTIIGNNPISKKMINHIIFLIDASSSMNYHLAAVKTVFDTTLESFKNTQSADQAIHISLYQFATGVDQVIFDTDINKLNTSISFRANGMTSLRDAVNEAIIDHKKIKVGKDEDHTFLIYAITDGQDNMSRTSPVALKNTITNLDDAWTVAALVPSVTDMHHAKTSGFASGNIQIWDTNSSKGFEEVGRAITASYQTYSNARSQGVRSSNNIFAINTDNISKSDIKRTLLEINGDIHYYNGSSDISIKEFAEDATGESYRKGSVFYEISKTEIVQASKEIAIVNKKDGKKYSGRDARDVLGLPHHETKMKPGEFGDWRIFIQSTSYTRKIKPGNSIFVIER